MTAEASITVHNSSFNKISPINRLYKPVEGNPLILNLVLILQKGVHSASYSSLNHIEVRPVLVIRAQRGVILQDFRPTTSSNSSSLSQCHRPDSISSQCEAEVMFTPSGTQMGLIILSPIISAHTVTSFQTIFPPGSLVELVPSIYQTLRPSIEAVKSRLGLISVDTLLHVGLHVFPSSQ